MAPWVDDVIARLGLGAGTAHAVQLCLEEAVVNVVSYAFEPDTLHAVHIALWRDDGEMHAEVTDDGRPFDPRSHVLPPQPKDLELAQIGGLGIKLMRSYAARMDYRRSGEYQPADAVVSGGVRRLQPKAVAGVAPRVRNLSDIELSRASHSWLIGWFSISAWNRTIIMIRNSGLRNAARNGPARRAATMTVTMPRRLAHRARQHHGDRGRRRQQQQPQHDGQHALQDDDPDGGFQDRHGVLGVVYHALARAAPRFLVAARQVVGEDHLVEIARRRAQDDVHQAREALQAGDGQHLTDPVQRAVERGEDAAHQQVQPNSALTWPNRSVTTRLP